MSLQHLLDAGRRWLATQVAPPHTPDPTAEAGISRLRLALACVTIFLLALGVGLLHWQDYHLRIGTDMSSLVTRYQTHAERLLAGENILFPPAVEDRQPIQLLVHPPGYPVFLATVYAALGNHRGRLVFTQICCSAAAAVLIFLIVAELLPRRIAWITGLLAAFSPHLWHYTLALLPDALVVLPTLMAVLLLVKASHRPRLWLIAAVGVMLGLSCWLRANGLLLAAFFAAAIFLLFDRQRRLRYALTLAGATALMIAPITIRNYVVFGRFIPLSLGAGVTMVEGIADYDLENRFDMPHSDAETKWKDAEWHNRPDYAEGLWRPDGIARDRYRFARGLAVIRREPVWFAGVMLRRAGAMLRYNDSLKQGWAADTTHVPVVALEPAFGHDIAPSAMPTPALVITPSELLAAGTSLSAQARCTLIDNGQSLRVEGDDTSFDDQFASAPIPVEQNSDYLLRLPVTWPQGKMAIKVTSVDRGIALASEIIAAPEANRPEEQDSEDKEDSAAKLARVVEMPFATGRRDAVRIIISNDGASGPRSASAIGQAELYAYGTTPRRWTRIVRPPIRSLQRNIYTTSRLPWLIAAGCVLLLLARRWRATTILLIVPLYYLCVQSAFHTEYRYILPIHYFLFAAAATTLAVIGAGFAQAMRWVRRKIPLRSSVG